MMKRKITKAEHTALNPLLQAEYRAEGEDFVLNAEGFDDPAELKRALDREREEKRLAKEKADKAESDLQTLRDATARSSGDVVTLENSWKKKVADNDKAHKEELEKRDKHLQSTLVDSVANGMAIELGGENSALLLPWIKQRLTADVSGDVPLTRVLDKDGKPSAFSVDELKKEISTDPRFKTVIIASRASGGGAAGGAGNGSGAPPAGKKFAELNDKERREYYNLDPIAFEAASKASAAETLQLNRQATRSA